MYTNEGYGDIVKRREPVAPLNINAYNGNADIVSELIASGEDVNVQEDDGWTPLHHSAFKGHADIVNALLGAGAEVDAKNKRGKTPLHHSVFNGNVDIVKAFIAAGAEVDANKGTGWTPLFYSGKNGRVDITEALLAAGADVNATYRDGMTPLLRVVNDGNTDSVKALIAAGADTNAEDLCGKTSLHFVAQIGGADIVKALIDAGADFNAKDNMFGWTPLFVSAQNGHGDITKAFISAGADVNAKAIDGRTPLHSLNSGSKDIKAALTRLSSIVHVNTKSQRKVWPHNAGSDHAYIARILIAAGADVGVKDNRRMTALHPDFPHTIEVSRALIKYALLYQCGSKCKTDVKHGEKELRRFWKDCKKQVKKMKKTCPGSSCTSFFKFILESDQNKLALYLSEENFCPNDELKRVSYIEKFPVYAEDIEAQFYKGFERANLLLKSQQLMKSCFCCPLFPEITRKITEYMTNDDLKNFLMISKFVN